MGDFIRPAVSCGLRVTRGAVVHLELGNCFTQTPAGPGQSPKRIPLTTVGENFYNKRRGCGQGAERCEVHRGSSMPPRR